MQENPEATAAMPWRITVLEGQVKKLDEVKADADDVKAIAEEVKSIRRALYTFALSVVGSSIVFAFTVFELLGKP